MGLFIKVPQTLEYLIHSFCRYLPGMFHVSDVVLIAGNRVGKPFSLISFTWVPRVSVEAKKKLTDKIFI